MIKIPRLSQFKKQVDLNQIKKLISDPCSQQWSAMGDITGILAFWLASLRLVISQGIHDYIPSR